MTFEQLSRISSVCNFSTGRPAPLHGADGEADRREFPLFRKDCPQGREQSAGHAVRRNPKGVQSPARSRKPAGNRDTQE
nr:hypothetical protein [Bacteroides acidifaciens]